MAAAPGDGHKHQQQQQQQRVTDEGESQEDQQPPIAEASGGEPAPGEHHRRRKARRSRQPDVPVAVMAERSAHALMLCRRNAERLLWWFASRPLGQRALEAMCYTISTAEQATLWAGAATGEGTGRRPPPLSWFLMMPVVMALMVVRTGAALVERYLDTRLPQNSHLVTWFENQRIQVERIQAEARINIRTLCVDENDPMHSFLNKWPFNIPYKGAQQLGLIPLRVNKQPSNNGTESSSSTLESAATAASSGSSTVTEGEQAAPAPGELIPPPETTGDTNLDPCPDGERETKKEKETEIQQQQQGKEEEVEGEKTREEQTEQPARISEEEAYRAASAVVFPQPSAPPEHLVLEDEYLATAVAVLSQPRPATSQKMLGTELASRPEPATSSRAKKPTTRPSKSLFFSNLFGAKLF